MSVVIDEIIQDNPAENTVEASRGPAAAPAASSASALPDLDQMAHEYHRRQHRISRLWAD